MVHFDNHISSDGITEDNFIKSKASIEPWQAHYLCEVNGRIINLMLLSYDKCGIVIDNYWARLVKRSID